MKSKIVVVGSANTDMIVKVKQLPQPGETVLGGDYIQAHGGKGANQAVAAAQLGAEVTFVARVGLDDFGKAEVASYKAEGIDTKYISWDKEAPSGVALITVDSAGENTITVASGANGRLSVADIVNAEPAIKEAKCLLVQLEIPLDAVQSAIKLAAKHQVPVILNPAPAKQLPADLLKMVDYLTPNEKEVATLAGNYSTSLAKDAASSLGSKLNIKNVIITLGKDGAMVASLKNTIVPAFKVTPVDTTGAGDAFNGGLAVALARGDKLFDAVRFANAVAALSTKRPGAQPSMPTLGEVNALLESQESTEPSKK